MGFVGERKVRITEDLDRACQRVDCPIYIISSRTLESFKAIRKTEFSEEGEEMFITDEAVVIVVLDPVVLSLIRGQASTEEGSTLEYRDCRGIRERLGGS